MNSSGNPTNVYTVPSVSIATARTGASSKANEQGMRTMQERAYARRGEQYLLLKSPPASGKSRALMFIALDKLHNQGLKQAIVVVPERSIGSSFADEALSQSGFYWDWQVAPQWNLCNAPGVDKARIAKSKVQAVRSFLDSADQLLLAELGLQVTPLKASSRTPREERIIAGFEDILRFHQTHGRAPLHGEDRDIFERLYAVRLDQIRRLPEAASLLGALDQPGLLAGTSGVSSDVDSLDEDRGDRRQRRNPYRRGGKHLHLHVRGRRSGRHVQTAQPESNKAGAHLPSRIRPRAD